MARKDRILPELDAWQRHWPAFRADTRLGAPANAQDSGAREFSIEDAALEDINFFIRNIDAGALRGVFSEIYLDPREKMKLAYRLAKAILQRRAPWFFRGSTFYFIVVKSKGRTIAAANAINIGDGKPNLLIDVVVVDPAEQKRSIGSCLIDYLIASQPPRTVINLLSTSYARGMKKIVRSRGMKNMQHAHVAGGVRVPHWFSLEK